MVAFDPRVFQESILVDLASARVRESEQEGIYFGHHQLPEDEDYEQSDRFDSVLSLIYLKLSLALEALGAKQTLRDLRREWKRLAKAGLSSMRHNSTADYAYSPALATLDRYHDVISAVIGGRAHNSEKAALLVQILEQTAFIVQTHKLEPSNEADVRRMIYTYLQVVFPDVAREIGISKPSKTYKPDFGVRSLQAAVEYKFVDSEPDAKKVLGEIYEDIRGYAGSLDWTEFYAVIYMTGEYISKHTLKAEWQLSDPHKNWHPIFVVGRGSRK